jgi:heptosyltransferase-2
VRERAASLAGQTSLDQAIAVIGAAQAMLTNDSGLMHVAAALSVPQQAVFGSSDPRHTPPLSDKADIHWLHLPCSPCFQRQCPLGHSDCLVKLAPQPVSAALQARLS